MLIYVLSAFLATGSSQKRDHMGHGIHWYNRRKIDNMKTQNSENNVRSKERAEESTGASLDTAVKIERNCDHTQIIQRT